MTSTHLYAASSKHDLYTDIGLSSTKNSKSTSQGWYHRFGYNYYFSPFMALDLSYTDSRALDDPENNPTSDDLVTSYKGLGAGVKFQHHLSKRFSVYAKGGASHLTITEKSWDQANQTYIRTEDTGIYPYGSLGVNMLTPMKNFKFNASYNFQLLNSSSTASAFTVGVDYQFK
ncbi:porin family protein [Vibrio kagoshimensis]|uniref:outer membrane beta-barrel protein n=1 Tax=Vibrio kagoshimensis TaxID=2910244 RepID=UPI003D21A62C